MAAQQTHKAVAKDREVSEFENDDSEGGSGSQVEGCSRHSPMGKKDRRALLLAFWLWLREGTAMAGGRGQALMLMWLTLPVHILTRR